MMSEQKLPPELESALELIANILDQYEVEEDDAETVLDDFEESLKKLLREGAEQADE